MPRVEADEARWGAGRIELRRIRQAGRRCEERVGERAADRSEVAREVQTMTIGEFRAICYAKDFTTFVVHLKDGRRLIVSHPFATMIHPDDQGDRVRLGSFCFYEDPPDAEEDFVHYRLSEIERVELRPDLPWYAGGRRGWVRKTG
jgi:hypothetical protein